MSKPNYLPGLPVVNPRPNFLRSGLPIASGATVDSVTLPGPLPPYLAVEPLINPGTTACYMFGDAYCYSGGATPVLGQAIALDLANNQHTCSTAPGPMTYDNGGFVFTATNATDGTATPATQGITFKGTDLQPTAQVNDYYVSTIWIAPTTAPASTDNGLIFTYPDGSTWAMVDGVLTFTPVGQTAIALDMSVYTWNATLPLQLGYSIGAPMDSSNKYSVTLYLNGAPVDEATDMSTVYTPAATPPTLIGFGPNATATGSLYAFKALRFYMEDVTVSGVDPSVVVAADYVFNYEDVIQFMANDNFPTVT